MECRPHGDSKYMQYKKQQLEDSNKPKREIISLEKPVNTYKPVNTHAFIVSMLHVLARLWEGSQFERDSGVAQW